MSKDSSSNKPTKIAVLYRVFPAIVVSLGSILLFIFGQLLGLILFTVVMSLAGFSPEEITDALSGNPAAKLLATFLIEAVSVGAIILLLKYLGEKPFKFLKLDNKFTFEQLKQTLITYCLYFASFVVIVTIGSLIPQLDVDQQQQLGYGSISGMNYIFVFITLVVLPPIAEEILFRGFLYQNLKRSLSIRTSAVITSLIFAAAHLEFLGNNPLNFIAAIDTFVLSLFLIKLLENTKSLWPSIMLHALKNSIAFVVLFVI